MTVSLQTLSLSPARASLKRTATVADIHPRKAPRMLTRTVSYLSLSDCLVAVQQQEPEQQSPPHVPYKRSLQHYKAQREHRKAIMNRPNFTVTPGPPSPLQVTRPPSSRPPKQNPSFRQPRQYPVPGSRPKNQIVIKLPDPNDGVPRFSSPLAPTTRSLPPRPKFPRSKPAPDLFRMAIRTRMRSTPEGKQILKMGPRVALSVITATRELEMLVNTPMEVVESEMDGWEAVDLRS